MLSYDLSDEQRLFRDTVREFAEGEIGPVAEELDREGRFPVELVRRAAELGLMGIPLPEEWGGAGAGTVSYAIAVEELARVDSSFAITVDQQNRRIRFEKTETAANVEAKAQTSAGSLAEMTGLLGNGGSQLKTATFIFSGSPDREAKGRR